MKNSIENITREDVLAAIKYNATFGELESIFDLVKIIENESMKCSDLIWQKMCVALYAYKLGEMQGKREERMKKKQYKRNRGIERVK